MNSLRSFIALEWHTVKPSLPVKVFGLYGAVAAFLAVMLDNPSATLAVAIMVAMMLIGIPFGLAERTNLDGMYVTLGFSRKQVVAGRFAFVTALSAIGFLACAALAATVNLVMGRGLFWLELGVSAVVEFLVACLLLFLQWPVYFKVGFTRGQLASKLPLLFVIVVVIGGSLVYGNESARGAAQLVLEQIGNAGALVAAIAVAFVAAIGFVSYRLSATYYQRREF
jgi:hypothetical protein